MNKNDLLNAKKQVDTIDDLLSQAQNILNSMPDEVKCAMLKYHNDDATLTHCLRWGLQAIKEIREDWHTVASEIVCEHS